MRVGLLASVVACVLLVGCDQATMMKKFTPAADEAIAKSYAQLIQERKFDQIEQALDPSIVNTSTTNTLAQMADFFPSDAPDSVKVVGAHTFRSLELSRSDITLEYQFPTKWLLVNVVTQKKKDVSTVVGLNVTPIPDSLENLNRFTLAGKTILQYLTLICAVGLFVFTLCVFVLCIRTRDLKLKWLWLIGVLVGVGSFAVDWRTGQWTWQLFAVRIPCFTMSHVLYSPWIVAAHFPLGAVAFLQHRWHMAITGESIPPTPIIENSLSPK